MQGLDGFLTDLPFGPVVGLVVGAVLLLAGRRLFWLAVGVVGFLTGFTLAARLLTAPEPWVGLVAGLFAGLLGAGLAVLLQRLAVGLAGFLVGGAGAAWIADAVFTAPEVVGWVVFVIAGALCALAAGLLFEAVLIVLSALVGALLVVGAFDLTTSVATLAGLTLTALGIAVQSFTRPPRRERRREEG